MNAMLARMPADLLTEWQAFFELEPFGTAREDLRAGTIAAAVANFRPFRPQDSKALKPSDFFENLRTPTKSMTSSDLATEAKKLTLAMGGRVQTREEAQKRAIAEKKRQEQIAAAKAQNAERIKRLQAEQDAKRDARKKPKK